MSNTTEQVTTAEQLAAMPDDGKRYELVDGVLRMMSPTGSDHGGVAAILLAHMTLHARKYGLGRTYAAETGFLLQRNPDTVLAPDAAFVSLERLGGDAKYPGYLPLCPDLVAEVVSPGDRSSAVEAKTRLWLDAGARVVLVVDPRTSTVREYRSGREAQVYTDGYVDLSDVLAGFQLDVADLFA